VIFDIYPLNIVYEIADFVIAKFWDFP